MTKDEEIVIIKKVWGGDSNAFEALILDNQSMVYNLALRMTGSSEDSRDLTQDIFFRAYKSIRNFRGDSKFSVWLYRLASNACIDFLRRRKEELSLTVTDEDGEVREFEIPDARYSPETEFERQQLKEAVNRGLLRLPADQRQILIMRDINGLQYDAIGEILEIPEGTVKSRLHRARRNLAEILLHDMAFGNFSPENPSDLTERKDGR